MYQSIKFHIRGIRPTVQHNGALADPTNYWAKQLKAYTGKRSKTDEDYLAMHELEFKGGLYLEDEKKGKTVIWPAENIEAMFRRAAKTRRKGTATVVGIIVPEDAKLIYDGPQTRDGLWEDERFRLYKRVRVKNNTVMRCRPIFNEWETKFQIEYLPERFNLRDVKQLMQHAGDFIGLSEWPGKYGLFQILNGKK